jgi:SAM-dependent methyltransferase
VLILSHKAFFWPLWTDEHLHWIFGSTRAIPLEETYANHLWEARAWKYLDDLTPGQVRSVPSNFHNWIMPMLLGVPDRYGTPPITTRLRKSARRVLNGVRGAKHQSVAQVKRVFRRVARLRMNPSQERQDIFSEIYSHKLWGGDSNSKFFSGVGSRGGAAATYADRMAGLLRDYIKQVGRPITIVDLGCGDFQVGQALLELLPEVSYVGCDIVPELIEFNNKTYKKDGIQFRTLDIVTDDLPKGDVCLVRQVLQHLSNADISAFLQKQKYSRLYVTEGQPSEILGPPNPDKLAGADVRFDWRSGRGRGVELDKSPFNYQVSEVFRAKAPPHEVIVTHLVARTTQER